MHVNSSGFAADMNITEEYIQYTSVYNIYITVTIPYFASLMCIHTTAKYNDNDKSIYYAHLFNACPEVIPNMFFLLGCWL